MPLILLYIACVAAPLVVVAGLVTQIRARQVGGSGRNCALLICQFSGEASGSGMLLA